MSLSGVSGKNFFYEKINTGINQKAQEKKKDGFLDNLDQAPEKEKETGSFSSVQVDYSYVGAESAIWMHQNGRVNMSAVFECKARHIAYHECDSVKVFIAEGFTLKAQVEMNSHMVYIEQKNEDGSVYAYEVNPLKISPNSQNPIEQMAVESWEKARELLNDGMVSEINPDTDAAEEKEQETITFQEWLTEFHEFVKKRIKDGPPKITIGGSEFSEKEWEQLMAKIDDAIDAYKEELRQRIREREEQEEVKNAAGSAVENKSLAEVAGAESSGKREQDLDISKMVSIEEARNKPHRATTSFLERIRGEKKAPYSYLADESGNIVYKGVVFTCNDKKQTICLGDMSNPNNVLNIPLSKGGVLRVNRDSIGDLVKAIDMFSPQDIARILRVIAQDKKIQDMELEIKEAKSEDPSDAGQGTAE